jgi:tetratricopeptide (TPR) repeat protein
MFIPRLHAKWFVGAAIVLAIFGLGLWLGWHKETITTAISKHLAKARAGEAESYNPTALTLAVASPIPALTPATSTVSVADRLRKQAEAARESGDTVSALARLQEAFERDPKNAEVLAEMAMIYESIQNFDRAAETWREVQQIGPSAGPLYELADTKLKVGIPTSVAEWQPTSPYATAADFAKYAMKVREQAVLKVPPSGVSGNTSAAPPKAELEESYSKAFKAFEADNFAEAIKELDAIDARQPDLAESHNLRGVLFMRHGMYDKADAALQESIRINPKFWNARFNLAEIPFLKKDWAEARNRFQELLSSDASELRGEATQLIQYKILLTYLLEGKESMVDSILAKFELSPDTPAVHYANAAIALQQNKTKEAKDWMAQAEKNFSPQLNKLFAESLYEVGWLKRPSQEVGHPGAANR